MLRSCFLAVLDRVLSAPKEIGQQLLAHLFIIGPSAFPALILGALSVVLAYAHRNQLAR